MRSSTIFLWLALLLPAIPSIYTVLDVMGLTEGSAYGTETMRAWHPIAAMGLGMGVYCIILMVLGLGYAFFQILTIDRRKP